MKIFILEERGVFFAFFLNLFFKKPIKIFIFVYEAGLLIVGMLLSNFTFAVCFNTVGQIVQDLDRDLNKFKYRMQIANKYRFKKVYKNFF